MNWPNWEAFWAMGGYGLYVWGSVGAVLLFIVAELVGLALSRRALLDDIRHESRSEA
ncbi:heme exporter protein CcmD [Aquabacterium sp.]|jgi:heme exporter protein D|uniref:heme exporter protein CcmD n=1 Tax=Aquabacterium sp. TaxID=1872578 RepID=UPI0027B94E4E|nr:heme exporter protein CcmD [Aquabacterium sp.]